MLSSTVELRESIAQRPRHYEVLSGSSGTLSLPEGSLVDNTYVLYDETFRVSEEATWTILQFDRENTFISEEDVDGCTLKVWSTLDQKPQLLNAHTLAQWDYKTAEFTGNEVRVQVLCAGDAKGSARVSVVGADVGEPAGPQIETLCSSSDRRQATTHRANARYVPGGSCTGWIFEDPSRQYCFVTASHCSGVGRMEFNVPISGSVSPNDQYSIDSSSIQSTGSGVGNDAKYFGGFPNSNHGSTAHERQNSSYRDDIASCRTGPGALSHTGFGSASGSLNLRQKGQPGGSPSGSNTISGNALRYRFDTTGGDSGSPVSTGSNPAPDQGGVCGVHTHGGCTPTGGQNAGTWLGHTGFQGFLNSPRGVCASEGAREAKALRYGVHFRGNANARGPCVFDCAEIQ